jgi:hypothetical protein
MPASVCADVGIVKIMQLPISALSAPIMPQFR